MMIMMMIVFVLPMLMMVERDKSAISEMHVSHFFTYMPGYTDITVTALKLMGSAHRI